MNLSIDSVFIAGRAKWGCNLSRGTKLGGAALETEECLNGCNHGLYLFFEQGAVPNLVGDLPKFLEGAIPEHPAVPAATPPTFLGW